MSHIDEPRDRVLSLSSDVADLLKDLVDRARELHEHGVPAREWLDLVAARLPNTADNLLRRVAPYLSPLIDGWLGLGSATTTERATTAGINAGAAAVSQAMSDVARRDGGSRMREVIARLFSEAPRLDGAVDQAPALEVHILLRSGAPIQFSGVLSTTPEGGLRLLTPAPGGQMVESFFDYSDVTSVAVVRKITGTEASRIISPS